MTDLVIGGGRRFQPQRGVRNIAIALALLAIGALVAYIVFLRLVAYAEPVAGPAVGALTLRATASRPAASAEPARAGGDDTGTLAYGDSATLAYRGQLLVLHLAGSPQVLGAARGRLLGRQLAAPSEAWRAPLEATVAAPGLLGQVGRDVRLRWQYRFADDGIPGHQLAEIASLLAGAQQPEGMAPSYEWFVRSQVALDVGQPAPWSSGHAARALGRTLSAIAPVRDAGGDRLLVGHSLALPGVADGGDAAAAAPVVTFVRADEVIPFATVGWPSAIGALTGINAEGIAVLVHPARTADVTPARAAQPSALLGRDILENARTLADALKIIEHATPLGAASFVIVDGGARRFAVVERSPSRTVVRQGADAPNVVTGVFRSEQFADDPENDRAARIQATSQRAKRARALLRRRMVEPEDMLRVLRDRRAPDGGLLPLGHRGALIDPSALHTVLIDASTMRLWVADGPDAGARFRGFDLRHELSGAPDATPPDLPAAPEYDPSPSARVRAARGYLRRGRRAAARGHSASARELSLRALASAPSLPEALLFAGERARADGDEAAARELFQRCLDVGLDDPGVEDELRAILQSPR